MTDTITLEDKIRCIQREIKMREGVYGRWVEKGAMSLGKATHEIDCMKAILADLEAIKKAEELI